MEGKELVIGVEYAKNIYKTAKEALQDRREGVEI